MAIPLIIAGIALAASVAAAGIGRAVASGKEAEAKKIYDQAVADYGDDILPHLQKELDGKLPKSAFEKLTQGEGRQAERQTYKDLRDVYAKEGMTDADKAAMRLANNEVNAKAQSQYQAVQQQLAARGGAQNPAMAAALYSQAGADSLNTLGNMAAQNQIAARQRALQALEASGGLGQAMANQDVQQADAMDRINMWNFDQQKALRQQDFLNTMHQRDARNAARNKIAEYYMRQGDRDMQTAAQVGNAFSTFGGGASGYAGDMGNIKNLKGGK